jgi:hypothetical protein
MPFAASETCAIIYFLEGYGKINGLNSEDAPAVVNIVE